MAGWVVWGVRTVLTIVISGSAIWYGAFRIADYTSEKYARGLTIAIDTLKTSISDLNQTVTATNVNLSGQLLTLERERSALALEIATKVNELRSSQAGQDKDIQQLSDALARLETQVAQLADSFKVKIVYSGGKEFKTLDAQSGTEALVGAWAKAGFNVPDGSVLSPFQFVLPAKN